MAQLAYLQRGTAEDDFDPEDVSVGSDDDMETLEQEEAIAGASRESNPHEVAELEDVRRYRGVNTICFALC